MAFPIRVDHSRLPRAQQHLFTNGFFPEFMIVLTGMRINIEKQERRPAAENFWEKSLCLLFSAL
jgi:hypothetical protein